MSMMLCIDAAELRKALAEIEAAEKNGFMYCLAVYKMAQAGPMLDECRAVYSDLLERAHPTNSNYNWGRFQRVTQTHRFRNDTLVPIKQPTVKAKIPRKRRPK